MSNNSEEIDNSEYNNLSYAELSDIVRKKAKVTGRDFIPILYKKLLKENKKPNEAKLLLEHDFGDIWSKTYINEFIPEDAKDEDKVKAGQISQEKQKAIRTTTGQNSVQLLRTGNNPTGEKKTESSPVQNPPKPISSVEEVIIELSAEECREIKANSILRGRKFKYSLNEKKVTKWI